MEANRITLVANLLTVGNGICGFAAIALVSRMPSVGLEGPLGSEHLSVLSTAGWLILLGMVFDVFDGRVARLAGSSSQLGAHLDSLADLVTFGVAPAMIILRSGASTFTDVVWWQRAVWLFSLAYCLGALLRLARFTAEQGGSEEDHVAFRGIPTPGAAGCVASLVIFQAYIFAFQAKELQWLSDFVPPERIQHWVGFTSVLLPILGLILGFTMVSSRIAFSHVGSWILARRHSFDTFVYIIFGALIVCIWPEPILPVLFIGYLVHAPVRHAARYLFSTRREPASHAKSLDGE